MSKRMEGETHIEPLTGSVLRLQIASFAAGRTVVEAVFAQANVIAAQTKRAVVLMVALALPFFLFADQAVERVGHTRFSALDSSVVRHKKNPEIA